MTIRPASEPTAPKEPEEIDGEADDLALDDATTLPELDGEAESEASIDEDTSPVDDETVGLDDATAEEAAEAVIDLIADVESEGWETSEDDDVDADDELDGGESESWTEGSDDDTSTPLDVDAIDDPAGVGDAGEEGIEDDVGELELPPRAPDAGDEAYPDELELG